MAFIKIRQVALNPNEVEYDRYISIDKIVAIRPSIYSLSKNVEIDCLNGKTYSCLDTFDEIFKQIGNF